ncbi:MAG: hypothetical protein V1734_05390, partial [Nanoarchaeota archaeon]
MNRIIGDRKKSALDEMMEVSMEFNEQCREEERIEKLQEERRRSKEIITKTDEIKAPSDEGKTLLEKVNNMPRHIYRLYYDGIKDYDIIKQTSIRSTASVAVANMIAGDKFKSAECFADIGMNLGKDYSSIGRTNHLFTDLSEAFTADNAYTAIYCFLEGSSGTGKDILEEIEKRIPKINTGHYTYYQHSETKKECFLTNQSLMYAARTYAGQNLEAEYRHLKELRQRHGTYDNYNDAMHTKKSLETTKATAS